MNYLPLAIAGGTVLGYYAYRQWGIKGAVATALGMLASVMAALPKKRPIVAPPPPVDLDPVKRTAGNIIESREKKAREAIQQADADELVRRMQDQS